jgi:hypothetical protein
VLRTLAQRTTGATMQNVARTRVITGFSDFFSAD